MIILDTNLVCEPLKPKPHAAVLAWLDRQAPETLYLTTITLAELQAGIEVLPVGKRRKALQSAAGLPLQPLWFGIQPCDHPDHAQWIGYGFAVHKPKLNRT